MQPSHVALGTTSKNKPIPFDHSSPRRYSASYGLLTWYRRTWPDLVITFFFIAAFLVQLAHHNLWRDELNAFGLANASPTLASLFWRIHYEGHPWLWYFLLWCVTHITSSPVGMKVLEAIIIGAAYLVLGLGSPFSRAEKVLLFLNYFISFEYAVLTRMYGVLLLLALLYARERSLQRGRAFIQGLLLGLMASTDVMGMILSAALFSEYFTSAFFCKTEFKIATKRQMATGIFAYLSLAMFAVWSARPSTDISWRTTGRMFTYTFDHRHLLDAVLSYIVLPYFPAAFGHRVASFWNPYPNQHRLFFALCLPFILLAIYRVFRRSPNLLVLLGVAMFCAVMFGHLVYLGTIRHNGVTFLAFLVALWILRTRFIRVPTPAMVLLAWTALSGIYVAYEEWQRPFSNAEPTVTWLKQHHLENAPIAGTPDTTVASLAVLLQRPIYMLDCSCKDSYLLFSKRRDSFSVSEIPDRLVAARSSFGRKQFFYITATPVDAEQERAVVDRGLALKKLAQFTRADAEQEDFYVYEVSSDLMPQH